MSKSGIFWSFFAISIMALFLAFICFIMFMYFEAARDMREYMKTLPKKKKHTEMLETNWKEIMDHAEEVT